MVRDALGGVRGSSLSIFTGFSKDFEKLNFQKLEFGQNEFKTYSYSELFMENKNGHETDLEMSF